MPEERLRIDRRWSVRFISALLWVLWSAAGGVVLWIFWQDAQRRPVPWEWVKLCATAAFLAGVAWFIATFTLRRLVAWLECGDTLRFGTLLSGYEVPWREVGRVELRPGENLQSNLQVRWTLVDGRSFVLYCRHAEAEEVFALVEQQTHAEDWPGLPLARSAALTLLGLGAFALAIGLVLDVLALRWLLAAQAPMQVAGGPRQFVPAVVACTVVPLAGLAGAALGAYHLWKRPLIHHPGIERLESAPFRWW